MSYVIKYLNIEWYLCVLIQLYKLVYIRWEPRKLLELVFKPFVYVTFIHNKIWSNQDPEKGYGLGSDLEDIIWRQKIV